MHIIEENKEYKYGGFWVRFIASIIDGIIMFFVTTPFNYLLVGEIFPSYQMEGDNSDYWLSTIISIVLGVLYYAGMQSSSKQATVGKMCFDLKVVDLNGEQITFLRAVGRYFSKLLSALILMIGYIMAAFDSKKQALHDKLARTMVVYEK